MKNRCGYLFKSLNFRIRGSWTLVYPVIYQVRLALLAFTTVLMQDYLVMQTMSVILSSILITSVLGRVHPYKIVKNNYKEIINESVIILIMDLFLFYSDPTISP